MEEYNVGVTFNAVIGNKNGGEVVIIGRQQDKEMTVVSFSEISKYLNYEVLVSIPSRLPRIVVE